MRELKFKAKRIDGSGWVFLSMPDVMTWKNGFPCVAVGNVQISFNPDTICQFTGITDSQGNYIYEGDELRADGEYDSIVKYGRGAYCIQHQTDYHSSWVSFRDIDLKCYTLTGKNIKD